MDPIYIQDLDNNDNEQHLHENDQPPESAIDVRVLTGILGRTQRSRNALALLSGMSSIGKMVMY